MLDFKSHNPFKPKIVELPCLDINHKKLIEWILCPEGRNLIDREEWVDEHIQYNIFQQPVKQFYAIYSHIRSFFFTHLNDLGGDRKMQYYIHGWCNILEKLDRIDWHSHCDFYRSNMYHGIYCVDSAGASHTEYRLPGNNNTFVTLDSQQGCGHIISDMTTEHRTSENLSETPRITIAFDIIDFQHYCQTKDTKVGNQFIPLG